MSSPRTLIISRPFVLGWTLWLLISWLINLLLESPVRMTSYPALPVVRGMLISAMTGILLAWPALRLSQPAPAAPFRRTWGDLVAINLIFLIIMLMMHVQVNMDSLSGHTGWPLHQTFGITAVAAAWSLLIGLCIVIGARETGPGRVAALLAVAVLAGGGLLVVAAGGPADAADACPFVVLWHYARPHDRLAAVMLARHAGIVAAVGLIGWLFEWARAWFVRRQDTTM